MSLEPCVFPLDYHLCNTGFVVGVIVIRLGNAWLSIAHCYSCLYENRPFPLLLSFFFKHAYMKTTWWWLQSLHQLACSFHQASSFPPILPTEVREHAAPDSNTLFCSHPPNFYWCQPTFSQCLASLLPLDLLLVAMSALSFCFAPEVISHIRAGWFIYCLS